MKVGSGVLHFEVAKTLSLVICRDCFLVFMHVQRIKDKGVTLFSIITCISCVVELIVPNFRIKSFNVRFFLCLLNKFFNSLLTENFLHFHRFFIKIFLET